MTGLQGPSIDSRGNFAGLDTRPGFADSSQNSCSDMRNFQLREKSLVKRLGHQKMHDDAITNSCMMWRTENQDGVTILNSELGSIIATGGWSFEFSLKINDHIPTVSRSVLSTYFHANVLAGGAIELGLPGNFLTSAVGQIVVDTDAFISLVYDPATAGGTFSYYKDGVFVSSLGGVGGAIAPAAVDMVVGGPADAAGATSLGGPLSICELRLWDDIRLAAEIAAWDSIQLDSPQQADTDLENYWRMDEGAGFIWIDRGQKDSDVTFCFDPFVDGLISGSSGAIRNRDTRSQDAITSSFNTVLTTDMNYFYNAYTMTWEMNIRFSELPSELGLWQIAFSEFFGSAQGMRMSVISAGASTDAFFIFEYIDASAGGDSVAMTGPTIIAVDTTYHIAITNTRVAGVSRTFNMYLDGVLEAGPSVGTDDGVDTAVASSEPIQLTQIAGPGTLHVFDYTIDEIRLWTIARTVPDILSTSTRRLYDGEVTDELVAWWELEEKETGVLFTSAPDASGHFVSPPHLNFIEVACPEWSSSEVVAETPCIFGIHNYINNNSVTNDVLVHGPGATYKINETTSLLEHLTPFNPSGNANVSSVRFGRSGNRSYFANGTAFPWRWDGESLLRTGIELPRGSPSLVTSVGGVGWPVGDYSVGYTYLSTTGNTQYESAMSAVTEFTIGVAAVTLDIGNIVASDQIDVDKLQVYITKSNGEILLKAQVFPDVTGTVTITAVEADLIEDNAEEFNHNPPAKFKYMVERDGRMIWAGDVNSPRLFYFSEVDFPEYVGPLNSREHVEEVTGLAVGPNNELYVFGRNSRTLVLGNVADPRVPNRVYNNGGCLSHHSLEIITPFVYGIGTDGPFRTNAQMYQPVDEIQFSSIRSLLEQSTDKDQWDISWMSYNQDRKTLYFTVPAAGENDRSQFIPLQVDTGSWTRYDQLQCRGAMTLRKTLEGFQKTLGSCIEGFVCEIEEEGYKDGLADADAHSYVIDTVDTTNQTITLLSTPPATGDGVKGLVCGIFSDTDKTITSRRRVVYQDGMTLTLNGSVSNYTSGDTIFLGVYIPFYQTKSIDARTLTRRKKLFRWFETHHNKETSGDIVLLFSRIDQIGTKTIGSTPVEGLIDTTISSDGRFPIQIATERLVAEFGNVEPDPLTVFSYSIPFEQFGIT